MKYGKIIVDQVNEDGNCVKGYDVSLSSSEMFNCIEMFFPQVRKDSVDSRIIVGFYNEKKYAIRCKNVTYLGNPHPHYKKRIQISDDLYEFYDRAIELDAKPMLLGIYSFESNVVFVDFKIDTYIKKKAHNSSAHIYVSDLAAATEDGYFQKVDYFGNVVTAFRTDAVNVFLSEVFNGDNIFAGVENQEGCTGNKGREIEKKDYFGATDSYEAHIKNNINKKIGDRLGVYSDLFSERILPEIKSFFIKEEKTWNGIECYKKMIEAKYRNRFQPEWVGFFLEYEFEQYICSNGLEDLITYAQDKKEGGIDLDLFFPAIEMYGDLKAHSEESRGIQGNDWDTIFNIINKNSEKSHIYYIVCEHLTEKDHLHNYEVTKYWNTVQKKDNIMSYSARMKNSVRLKSVYILDINYNNKEYLTMFKQGINSNGKPRAPKIMIERDNLQHFLVEKIDL